MKKIKIAAVLFVFVTSMLVQSVALFTTSAYATSDYGMDTTNAIQIGGDSPNGDCDVTDMTAGWRGLLSPNTSNQWSYKNTWNYTNNYNNSRQKLDDFQDGFVSGLPNGSGWAVSVVDGSEAGVGAGNKMVRIATFDKDQEIGMIQGAIQFPDGAKVSSFLLNPNMGCRFQSWEENTTTYTLEVDSDNPIFFIASDYVDYPYDYSGSTFASSPGGVVTGNVQCANTNNVISSVSINPQSGENTLAQLESDGAGGKNYRSYVWNENYSLVVLCDGDSFYGPTVDENLYLHHDWVCTTTGDLPVCAAS